MSTILALDASEWQGRLGEQHFRYAYAMGVRMYIAQLWGSGPTGLGPNDYAAAQLAHAKAAGMRLAGYIWVPPDTTTQTHSLVQVALAAAGGLSGELEFVAPDLEGSRLHPTRAVDRLADACRNLERAGKKLAIYCSKNSWRVVMGAGVSAFKHLPLWEARYYFKSGLRPDEPPDIDWQWSKFGGWKERAALQYAGTAPVKGWSADWNVVDLGRMGLPESGPMPTPTPLPPKPEPKPEPEPEPKPKPAPPKEEDALSSNEFDRLNVAINKHVNRLEKRLEAIETRLHVAPPPSQKTYTVRPGDSLSLIAKKLLGNAGRFPEIVTLNQNRYPSLATNPNHIVVGWVLAIP